MSVWIAGVIAASVVAWPWPFSAGDAKPEVKLAEGKQGTKVVEICPQREKIKKGDPGSKENPIKIATGGRK